MELPDALPLEDFAHAQARAHAEAGDLLGDAGARRHRNLVRMLSTSASVEEAELYATEIYEIHRQIAVDGWGDAAAPYPEFGMDCLLQVQVRQLPGFADKMKSHAEPEDIAVELATVTWYEKLARRHLGALYTTASVKARAAVQNYYVDRPAGVPEPRAIAADDMPAESQRLDGQTCIICHRPAPAGELAGEASGWRAVQLGQDWFYYACPGEFPAEDAPKKRQAAAFEKFLRHALAECIKNGDFPIAQLVRSADG